MSERSYASRRLVDRVGTAAAIAAVLLALLPLGSVLWFVAVRGIEGLNLELFTELPAPVGEAGGGMGNAVLGSLKLVGLASAIGVPVGILAGIYLAESREGRAPAITRFVVDVMAGLPSITVGLFVYTIVVVSMKRFSAIAGAIALAILMLPTITRTTEELLRMVPNTLREAGLGLGVSSWRTTLRIVLRTAAPGIATGVMLAVARAAGETAPLLFTSFNNSYWSEAIDEPTASLPVQIYTYAVSPFEEWHRQAWAASLVLVGLVIVANIGARLLVRDRMKVSK